MKSYRLLLHVLPLLLVCACSADELMAMGRHLRRSRAFDALHGRPMDDGLSTPRPAGSFPPLDEAYEALPAEAKLHELYRVRVLGTAYPAGRLPSLLRGLFPVAKALVPHLLRRSLTRVADEFPRPRLKAIHTFGAVAAVEFLPAAGSPYTGLFRGAGGLARFSFAGPPIPLVGNVPGLGLKFLVDGRPSENLLVMNKLNDQGESTSVFQESFSNILPRPRGPIMNAIRIAFEAVVGQGNAFHQTLEHLAAVDRKGRPEARPLAPYRVFFEPVADYPFPADTRADFREDLARIPEGFEIYRVRAQATEGSSERPVIGRLVTRSRFVASSYGDRMLFFRHDDSFLKGGDALVVP